MSVAEQENLLTGQHVTLWPYVRGLYGRDTLYRLWQVIEQAEAAPSLFWGSNDTLPILGDLTSCVRYFEEAGRVLLIATTPDGGQIVGCVWFDDVVPQHRAFASIFIHPAHRATVSDEVVRLALRYAFDGLAVQSVWGITPWRAASALCLRNGFEVVAILPAFTVLRGVVRDVTVLRITKESYHG